MTRRWPRQVLLLGGLGVLLAVAALVIDYAISADDTAFENREAYADRARLYVIALSAVIAVSAGVALRVTPQRRELFNDLGVAGVVLGLLTAFVLSRELPLLGDQNTGIAWLPSAGLLAAAAIGTLSSRRSDPMPPSGVSRIAIGAAVATVVLVLLGHAGRDCGDEASGSDLLLGLAVPVGIAASVMGLIALAKRQWIAALISIPAAGVAFVSIVVAACLS